MILVEVSDATDNNDSVKSTQGTCMYPLTTFLDFRQIKPSGYSLLINTHLIGTGFLTFAFKALIFVIIHDFLDRKLFTSEIADIYHKCPFDLVIAFLRDSGSPLYVEIDIPNEHWILLSLCSTIGMNLLSPVTLYSPSMAGFCILGIVGLY